MKFINCVYNNNFFLVKALKTVIVLAFMSKQEGFLMKSMKENGWSPYQWISTLASLHVL